MKKWLAVIFLILAAGAGALRAQDYPFAPIDGPTIKKDTLSDRPQIMPLMPFQVSPALGMPSLLSAPQGFETREQRAARINAAARKSVVESVNQNLSWYRLPDLTVQQKAALVAAGYLAMLFLSNPYGYMPGYVPLMNHSNPFVFAKTPGGAPYVNMYSPERFPQAIRSEYDAATGTYKQVMVDWNEYQENLSRSLSKSLSTSPVPKIPVTPVERAMRKL